MPLSTIPLSLSRSIKFSRYSCNFFSINILLVKNSCHKYFFLENIINILTTQFNKRIYQNRNFRPLENNQNSFVDIYFLKE